MDIIVYWNWEFLILSVKSFVQEDIVVKLLDFLVAPYATTTDLLAEKDQVCFKDFGSESVNYYTAYLVRRNYHF